MGEANDGAAGYTVQTTLQPHPFIAAEALIDRLTNSRGGFLDESPAYLVVMVAKPGGQFEERATHKGSRSVRGRVQALVLDAETGHVSVRALLGTAPPIARLGQVSIPLAVRGQVPRTGTVLGRVKRSHLRTVSLRTARGRRPVKTTHASHGGRYSISARPGSYWIGVANCPARKVTVRAGRDTHVDLCGS